MEGCAWKVEDFRTYFVSECAIWRGGRLFAGDVYLQAQNEKTEIYSRDSFDPFTAVSNTVLVVQIDYKIR